MTTVNRAVLRAVALASAEASKSPAVTAKTQKWTAPADKPNDGFVTGAAKFRTIENPKQTVKLEHVTVPKFDYAKNKGVPLEVSLPLKSLNVSPLTTETFVNELANSKVTLIAPWAISDQGEQPKLSVVDGSLRLRFENVNINAVAKLPPQVNVKMPGGQLLSLELRPEKLVVDTRDADIANTLQNTATFDANDDWVKSQKSKAEDLRARAFVGFTEFTAYAER